MTFQELEYTLPNGFHDAEISKISLDYLVGSVTLHMNLLIGSTPKNQYWPAVLEASPFCVCSIDLPDPRYGFLPRGTPLSVSGDSPKETAPELDKLSSRFLQGTKWYRFFVEEWNSFILIATSDVKISWPSGEPPRLAASSTKSSRE